MKMTHESPDVVVIGGGPAGSTASTLIAQHGYRVELFEREHFPRFHIGESLIPETYWVLERLKMLDKMKNSHFVKKHEKRIGKRFDTISHSSMKAMQEYAWPGNIRELENFIERAVIISPNDNLQLEIPASALNLNPV